MNKHPPHPTPQKKEEEERLETSRKCKNSNEEESTLSVHS